MLLNRVKSTLISLMFIYLGCDVPDPRLGSNAASLISEPTSRKDSQSLGCEAGHSLVIQIEAISLPATFNAASMSVACFPGAYIQLPESFLALRIFKESLVEGLAMAYAWIIFLILSSVFLEFLIAVCRRTGICRNRFETRTVVPTGWATRSVLKISL